MSLLLCGLTTLNAPLMFSEDCSSAALTLLRQDMFIFRVEGTGVLRPDEVVSMALEWMQQKMTTLNAALQSNTNDDAMLE